MRWPMQILLMLLTYVPVHRHASRALDLLEQAVDSGRGDRAWMETDSDLDSLREYARFEALVGRID